MYLFKVQLFQVCFRTVCTRCFYTIVFYRLLIYVSKWVLSLKLCHVLCMSDSIQWQLRWQYLLVDMMGKTTNVTASLLHTEVKQSSIKHFWIKNVKERKGDNLFLYSLVHQVFFQRMQNQTYDWYHKTSLPCHGLRPTGEKKKKKMKMKVKTGHIVDIFI